MGTAIKTSASILLICLYSNISLGITYFVAKSGSDLNSCTQSMKQATPKLSITAGLACLSAGDTLYIRTGVYEESLNDNKVSFPSGASWEMPVTIAGYPGDRVTIRPNIGATEVLRIMGRDKPTQYLVFDNLILDGINGITNIIKITYTGSDPSRCANHIRVKNSEILNSSGQGIFIGNRSFENEFINLKIHNNGTTDFHHGIYITGANNIIERCEIYQNAGWGVHIYSGEKIPHASNNIVRNNRIHNNARTGNRGRGIIFSSGTNNIAYNNLLWGNNGGIQIDYGAHSVWVCNNTIWANNGGNRDNALGIFIGKESDYAIIQNNICWQNISGNIIDQSTNSTLSNNLSSSTPLFVDTAKYDFHLLPNSPAIDTGLNLSPKVIVDYDGISRPQGSAYDIGAFEYHHK